MEIFIRKAGFWNAKTWKLSSQFGHIMLRIDGKLYSFNQKTFLKDGSGCVQAIDAEEFVRTYAGQVWHVVRLESQASHRERALRYFMEVASEHEYSLRNNCAYECQQAIDASGLVRFERNFIFPGSILSFVSKNPADRKTDIRKVTVGDDPL